MSKRFFEGAQHAARYAITRPTYPPELMEKIINFLAMKYKGVYDYAVDIGCGSGQSTELLSPYFQKVYGYDVSENQIKEAKTKNKISNIEYQVSANNAIPHANKSLCLITAAQAAHWFDLKQFYSEANRTLKQMGVLALYGYELPKIDGENSTQLNEIFQTFYKKLLPYFPPDRLQIDKKYADIILPYEEQIRDESVKIKYEWNLDRFLAYVSTWSGYIHYMQKYPDKNIIFDLRRDLFKAMKTENENEPMKIYFGTFILLGHKNMLTYESIIIGQRVEVFRNDKIVYGTVLYKGPIVGRHGIWLGIDLATPDGDNDGTLRGRVYFRAPLNYGIFTTIDHIRLASDFPRKRKSVYRTVNKKSIVEEELFGNTDPLVLPPPSTNASISNSKVTLSLKNPQERPNSSIFCEKETRYPLPQTLAKEYDYKIRKERLRKEKMMSKQIDTTEFTFAPTPSIPPVFMPPSEVDRAKRTGFVGMSIPRYTVVYDQYDFLE
ncbi:unnamed protein product [Rotaria sp. Silwood1]|nr:unnamed protein product [Rotaria sp. Silwood1]CAF3758241.1 unnamed protein product [Rotaria sp. Silwood1]CAF3770577.1 unnamed protein product [Rotaria sp. Silwood1]CAF4631393.1 unnamed protein product [Rotaria sp. Silwood1]CAF4642221.1 unnamed protein product [Rotaria sp. Silwood1]